MGTVHLITEGNLSHHAKKAGLGAVCGGYMPEYNDLCSGRIEGWPYVSKLSTRGKARYYHVDCAVRLNVISEKAAKIGKTD